MAHRRGVYPGSFNPPTEAHLEIARAARDQHELDLVVLAVSSVALAKETVDRPLFEHRVQVLAEVVSAHSWLDLWVTDLQLLADISDGHDVIVMGADKWHQIHDVAFYGDDPAVRDAALARLPAVAIAPRGDIDVPEALVLDVGDHLSSVSSTLARNGLVEMMCAPARHFDLRTGAWTDPERYDRWLDAGGAPTAH